MTVCGAEEALHEPLKTCTLNVPLVVTLIDWVVAPLLQSHDVPLLAVSVTLPPAQNVVGPLGVMFAAGVGSTLTVCVSLFVHPMVFETVTL